MFSIYGPGASLELSSDCLHYICEPCGAVYDENLPCEECAGPLEVWGVSCDCWEDNAREIVDMIGQWYAAQGGDGCAGVFVVGSCSNLAPVGRSSLARAYAQGVGG